METERFAQLLELVSTNAWWSLGMGDAQNVAQECLDAIERLIAERDGAQTGEAENDIVLRRTEAECVRLKEAIEREAIEKARTDSYTLEYLSAGDAVGRVIDVGGLVFRVGCDEHANLTAEEERAR